MTNRFRISLPVISIECNKDSLADAFHTKCPLKKYLDSDESVYVAWPNENRLLPNTNDFQHACDDIEKIREICNNCKLSQKAR
ncbi:MAG: hypothetical protein IKN73_02495 [Alphaproteobacteria bacterium]|nr:hypothetical protein [Alphaproteobacteria bacterium]